MLMPSTTSTVPGVSSSSPVSASKATTATALMVSVVMKAAFRGTSVSPAMGARLGM